jgi:hypothetical protein
MATGMYLFIASIAGTVLLKQLLPQLHLLKALAGVLSVDAVIFFSWSVVIYPIFLSPLRHIPGPKGANLIFGHGKQVRLEQPRGDLARQWMETIPNDGLLRFKDLLNRDGLILTSPAMLKTVLNDNCYDYTKQRSSVNVLRPVLGDGLVLVEGDVHKFQRRRK